MAYSSTSSIDIDAPRSAVWNAVTDPAAVKEWFFGTEMDTDWKVGSPIFFRGEWEGKTYKDKGEVLEFTPEESLSYTYWSSMGGKEDLPENYQNLRYLLTEEDGHTNLTINQTDVASQEAADHSAKNWEGVLTALKEYVETKA